MQRAEAIIEDFRGWVEKHDFVRGNKAKFMDKLDAFIEEERFAERMTESYEYEYIMDFLAERSQNRLPGDPLFYDQVCKLGLYRAIVRQVGSEDIVDYVKRMREQLHPQRDDPAPLIRYELFDVLQSNRKLLEALRNTHDTYVPELVRRITYAGLTIMADKYLKRSLRSGKLLETPGLMFVRVVLEVIRSDDTDLSFRCLRGLLVGEVSAASPTLFNAGTRRPQMASCFTLEMRDDMRDIGKTFSEVLQLSKACGGIGMTISGCRAKDSYIAGTDGYAKGVVGLLPSFQDHMLYADQGGGKRKGAGANYLTLEHKDFWNWLGMAAHQQSIYYGVMCPDLFFERLKIPGSVWTGFCPTAVRLLPRKLRNGKKLHEMWGDEFRAAYEKLEEMLDAEKEDDAYQVLSKLSVRHKCKDIWNHIADIALTNRNVYVCSKDMINRLSMQQNVGPVTTSNLCLEIMQVTPPGWVSVCNLCSLILPTFVGEDGMFNFDRLDRAMEYIPQFMDRVIDRTFYPVESARAYNMNMRSLGIGIQGLADAFQKMDVLYTSDTGTNWSRRIMEAIQFGALQTSMTMAKDPLKGPYSYFDGSPYSKGMFHHMLWCNAMGVDRKSIESGRYNWDKLAEDVKTHGIRNSNLTALMPTASSSIIGGANECFYGGYPSNVYERQTNAGNLYVYNREMFERLEREDLYTTTILTDLFRTKGRMPHSSIGGEQELLHGNQQHLSNLFATIYEQSGAWMVKNIAALQPFVCQGISMSAHLRYRKSLSAEERKKKAAQDFKTFLLYAKEQGLVSLSYYPRSEPFIDFSDFGVSSSTSFSDLAVREERERGPCSSGACEA